MNFFKAVFIFYINSSIHVALSVYALVRITEKYFDLPYNEPLDYFILYGTVTGYNFIKYAGIAKLHHVSLTKNLRIVQVFSFLSFIVMLFYLFLLDTRTIAYFIPLGLLTVSYAIPVLKNLSINLRNTATIKIFIIALVWTGVTSLIPVLQNKEIGIREGVHFVQRFLFVIVLTLPFDIRDFKDDKKYLQTIPQLVGVRRSKKKGYVFLLFTMGIEFFIAPNQQLKFVYLIVFISLLFLVQRSTIKQSKYYASFWVESIPIFWWILLIFLS